MNQDRPLLEVNALKKHFPIHGGLLGRVTARVHAVDGVTFDIRRGETLSLVGESGCGKSTVGKAILRLFSLTDGEVYLDGERIDNMRPGELRAKRKRLHPVQNCSTRPNITVDTWRAEYEKDGKGRLRGVPIKTTCK